MPDTVPLIGDKPPVTPSDVWEIKLTLARIEERMAASSDAAEHRHANMRLAMENYVPRREIEQTFAGYGARMTSIEAEVDEKATSHDLGNLEKRLAKVEGNQERVIWSILGMIGVAVAGLFGVSLKH